MRSFNEIAIRCYSESEDIFYYHDMANPNNWYTTPTGREGKVIEPRLFDHEKTILSKPMLWTGSTDHENEYLYEGDYIENDNGDFLGLCMFNPIGNSFIVQNDGLVFNLDNINSMGRLLRCKIIGNIYQNYHNVGISWWED